MMDTAKMLNEARKARKKMSQMQVAGQSGSMAVLMNGLYDVEDVDIDADKLKEELGDSFTDEQIKKITENAKKRIKESMNDAKKQLEKELASMTSLDDLKNLLG